jgi:DNA-directed RNA polymerase specialized sigma24 family protein
MAEGSGNIEALVAEHYREVHGLLWVLTRNQHTADELAQEVFIVALKRGMAPGDGMRLWLRETARRLAMNELRRKRPAPLEPKDLAALPGMDGGP